MDTNYSQSAAEGVQLVLSADYGVLWESH